MMTKPSKLLIFNSRGEHIDSLGKFGYSEYALTTIQDNDADFVRNKLIHNGEVVEFIANIPKPYAIFHKNKVLNACFEIVKTRNEKDFYIISPMDRFYFLPARKGDNYFFIEEDFDIVELGQRNGKIIHFASVSGGGKNDHMILL